MTTRLAVMQRVAQHVGGLSGTITSGTTNTAILGGLQGGTGDDSKYVTWPLLMPSTSTVADKMRTLTEWDDSAAEAKWVEVLSGAPSASDVFILMPPHTWTLQELQGAVNQTLRETKRSVRSIIPTSPEQKHYWLNDLDWLRGVADIDSVVLRNSPNLLDNENFEKWQNGDASAPDSWTLAGTDATVARTTSYAARGPYAVTVTRAGTNLTLTQSLPQELVYYLASNAKTVAIQALVRTDTASVARVGIGNGSSTTYGSYHTGGGGLESLTSSLTLTSAATDVKAVISVDTSDAAATIAAVNLVVGSSVPQALIDGGSAAYRERRVRWQGIGVGSPGGVIQIDRAPGAYEQLVVTSRRPYAEVSTDTATIDCPADVLEHGTVYRLASRVREGQSRDHLDALARLHGPDYSRLAARLIEVPRSQPFERVVIRSA